MSRPGRSYSISLQKYCYKELWCQHFMNNRKEQRQGESVINFQRHIRLSIKYQLVQWQDGLKMSWEVLE